MQEKLEKEDTSEHQIPHNSGFLNLKQKQTCIFIDKQRVIGLDRQSEAVSYISTTLPVCGQIVESLSSMAKCIYES